MLHAGCSQESTGQGSPQGVVIQQPSKAGSDNERAVSALKPMQGTGLALVVGEVRVKALRPGNYSLLLPVPQLCDAQVPVSYSISAAHQSISLEARLQERDDGNVFVHVKLSGMQDQEAKISWSSIVLIAGRPIATNSVKPEQYLAATACVQSGDKQVSKLADNLWPATGKADEFAAKIQSFIREMKQKDPPRSLDTLGILKSGANWICTANANLACALMRAKRIPCRTIAVIPPNAHRLEMHRVVEYFDAGKWIGFDPSLVQADIPLKPWQSIIMAKTTIADEEKAMKPRVGSMFGCPFGQEVEFPELGLTLSGNEFFWAFAGSFAEFEVTEEAVELTVKEWKRFLKSGVMSDGQNKAVLATSLQDYLGAWRKE